jgi:hypothetical protein
MRGSAREVGLRLAALLGPALVVALLAYATFGSFDRLLLALDRASALGPCHGPDGARPLCDFANHYYPQGQALAHTPVAVPGFFYSAFFALGMRLLAYLPYPVARASWAVVVLAAAVTVLLAPLWREFRRSTVACLAYGCVVATALPLWHDLAFGQVSSLLTALVLLAFVCHARERRIAAGVLVGLAASIKFYPALFAVYFALRRDRRASFAFLATAFACTALLPLLVLGEAGLVNFYRTLGTGLEHLARGTAGSDFSNFAATVVARLVTGHGSSDGVLYQTAVSAGLAVAAAHAWLLWRMPREDPAAGARAGLVVGMATIPFVVRSCWVHYFVFLPLLQAHVFEGRAWTRGSRPWRAVVVTSAVVSAVLVSVPLFLLVRDLRYYESGLPLWATVVLLPGLYLRLVAERRAAEAAAAQR